MLARLSARIHKKMPYPFSNFNIYGNIDPTTINIRHKLYFKFSCYPNDF